MVVTWEYMYDTPKNYQIQRHKKDKIWINFVKNGIGVGEGAKGTSRLYSHLGQMSPSM